MATGKKRVYSPSSAATSAQNRVVCHQSDFSLLLIPISRLKDSHFWCMISLNASHDFLLLGSTNKASEDKLKHNRSPPASFVASVLRRENTTFEFGKKWDISVCPFGFGCLFRALTSGPSLLVQHRTCESVPLTTRMSNGRADDVGVLDDCLLVMSDRLQQAHTSFAHSTWPCTSSICHY